MWNEVDGKPYEGGLEKFKVSNYSFLFYFGSWLADLTK